MKEIFIRFLKKNWFKVGIGLFLVFVAFQDDLHINLNLNQPGKKSIEQVPVKDQSPKRETLTDIGQQAPDIEAPAVEKTQRLNLQPFWSGWNKKEPNDKEVKPKPRTPRKKALALLAEVEPDLIEAFIRRFAHVAVAEQKKYGIPACITMANSLLMSSAGQAELSKEANNFFRIPCDQQWAGETSFFDRTCYRAYDTAWLSFRDHSEYIKNLAPDSDPTNYKAWIKALGEASFGSEKAYAKQVGQLIEDLELYYLNN